MPKLVLPDRCKKCQCDDWLPSHEPKPKKRNRIRCSECGNEVVTAVSAFQRLHNLWAAMVAMRHPLTQRKGIK